MTNNGNGVPAASGRPYSEIRMYELSLQFDQELIYNTYVIDALRRWGCPLDSKHIENEMCNLVDKYIEIAEKERPLYAADFDLESCPHCYCRDHTIVDEPLVATTCKHYQDSERTLNQMDGRLVSNSIKWRIFVYFSEHKQDRAPYIESLQMLKLKQDHADNLAQFYSELLGEIEDLFDPSVRAELDRALCRINIRLIQRLVRFQSCPTFGHESCLLCERDPSLQYQPDTEPEEIFRHFLGAFRLHFYESLVDFLRALPNE